jgi:hypothetical protein
MNRNGRKLAKNSLITKQSLSEEIQRLINIEIDDISKGFMQMLRININPNVLILLINPHLPT